MTERIWKEIEKGQDIRQNLSKLRQRLKDNTESQREETKLFLLEHTDRLLEFLKDEDAKARKNAALLLGDLKKQKFVEPLLEAYEKEKQLFVKSSYLKALSELDYKGILPALKEKLKELGLVEQTEENKKHILDEMRTLTEMIAKKEGIVHHCFTGDQESVDVMLVTARGFAETTKQELEELDVNMENLKLLKSGLRFQTDSLENLILARTYRELLFQVEGMKNSTTNPMEAARTVVSSQLIPFLTNMHDGTAPFYFRIEVKSKAPLDKRSEFAKKTAREIEHLSERKLINSTSNYEVELRFIEGKEESYFILLKLLTIPDERFSYRHGVIANGLKPVNAALLTALAKDYMKPDARVLDPFCGVATLLIERQKVVKGNTAYGIDRLGEAIEKAKENVAEAGQIIHFINRDFFDFTHDYIFDEIYTDMPFTLGHNKDEILDTYERFFACARSYLEEDGTIILYSHDGDDVKTLARKEGYEILKEWEISKKEQTALFVMKP